jgi:hypothetical protein
MPKSFKLMPKRIYGNPLNWKPIKQGVCHIVDLPFTLKSILMQKKNDGNSNISACKNIYSL